MTMEPSIGQCNIVNPNDKNALPKTFTFDGAYYTDSTTEQMYNEIVFPLVEVRTGFSNLIRTCQYFTPECHGGIQRNRVRLRPDGLW